MNRASDLHWPDQVPLKKLKRGKKVVHQRILGPRTKKALKKTESQRRK